MSLDLRLYVITDSNLAHGRPLTDVVDQSIAGGATVIQLREKNLSTRELVLLGQQLRKITHQKGVTFIVNDRLDVALAVGADGVHLGQDDMPVSLARRLLGPDKIIGVSADTPAEAEEAYRAGADYLGTGPIFPTSTKPDAGAALGIKRFATLCRQFPLPVVGIGGINAENADEVIKAGAAGVAVISAVIGAPNVTEAAKKIARAVSRLS